MARRKRESEQSRTLPDLVVARIRASLDRWRPGLWAEENGYGPACTCGLHAAKGVCYRHGKA